MATQEERLRGLVAKFRAHSQECETKPRGYYSAAVEVEWCADELEQALSAAPQRDWVEWVEPAIDSEPVYCRVSKATAVKMQRKAALDSFKHYVYPNDEQALEDFMTVHWAAASAPSTLTEEAQREVYLQWWHSISQLDRLHLTLRDAFDAGVREGRYGKASK